MSNLEQALINSGQANDEKEANDIVRSMLARTKDFEDPSEILEEYFDEFDSDWCEDILNWKQYGGAGSPNQSAPASKDEEKMMFKIKALLDKANSTDSQAEKDAFMMKAQELIQKNNLEYSRVIAVKGTKNKDGIIVDEAILEEIVKYDDEWDRKLMQNIAEGNMCKCLFGGSNIHIIGKASNCNSVLMLCDFYRKAILNLALEAAKRKTRMSKTLAQGKNGISARDLARIDKEEKENIKDYLFGAVDGLHDALTNKNQIFESETFRTESKDGNGMEMIVSGRDVMRLNRDKIMEYIDKKYPFRGSARFGGGGNSDSGSYQRGHADGGGLGSGQRRLN